MLIVPEEDPRPERHGIEAERRIGGTAATSLPPRLTLLFAAACGLSVANIYYAQPLLDSMASEFGIDQASIGIVVTVTQIGYALGLIFIVPLGDLFDRRRLIVGQAILSAVALVVVSRAPDAAVLLGAMAAVGLLAVVVQVLVAYAATLASPPERGKAVGTVTSGVVIGILLARFVSGAIADLGGWRLVYLTSAVLTIGMAALLYRVLPDQSRNSTRSSYPDLLRSVLALLIEEPVVRLRALFAFLIFATFSTFWTSMVLPLSVPPFDLSHTQIGLFGLAGLVGALAAGKAGHLADRGFAQWTTGLSLLLMFAAWVPIAFLGVSLWPVIGGVILLDLAIQTVHVTNLSLIFAVRPEAQSRLVAGYMVFYSVGSAFGSIASTSAYAQAGWFGVCLLGAGLSSAAFLIWLGSMCIAAPSQMACPADNEQPRFFGIDR